MTARCKRIAPLGIVVLAILAGQAFADPVGLTGSFNWVRQPGYFNYPGGEFTLYGYGSALENSAYSSLASNIGVDPSFQTFCIETAETALRPSYFVVGTAAVQGRTSSADTITQGTAWLYSQFAMGTLEGFTYSTSSGQRAASTNLLQDAIWMLEGETGVVASNPFYRLALLHGGTQDITTPGYLGVYVLNNFDTAAHRDAYVNNGAVTGKAQDFLYYRVADGGATLMLLGGALISIGALRRRFDR